MLPWILMCPASRGIGFELTRRLLQETPFPIVATARNNLPDTKQRILDGLDVNASRLEILRVDVTEEASVIEAAQFCSARFDDSYLHLAFAIPGVLHPERSPSQIFYDDALKTFQVNTLGPLLLMKHFASFLPNKRTSLDDPSRLHGLPAHATWINMSARVASIADNALGGWYSYRASKAAVNQLTKTFDLHLRMTASNKAMAVSMHPGTVKTDLSREFWSNVQEEKLFDPPWAAEQLLSVVKKLGIQDRGHCWDWAGKKIPP